MKKIKRNWWWIFLALYPLILIISSYVTGDEFRDVFINEERVSGTFFTAGDGSYVESPAVAYTSIVSEVTNGCGSSLTPIGDVETSASNVTGSDTETQPNIEDPNRPASLPSDFDR